MPDIFVIGGPNGAGKSTTAREMLPLFLGCAEFVNADEIAKGLSAFRPETVAIQAGRLMLERIATLARQKVDFAFESTLSSRSLAPWLAARQKEGYAVHVIYLWLPKPELAVARVGFRVENGGHSVPEVDILRRYERSRMNFLNLYRPLADTWELFDNSENEPYLIASGERGRSTIVLEPENWNFFTGGSDE